MHEKIFLIPILMMAKVMDCIERQISRENS